MVATWLQPFSCQHCAESAGSEKSPWSRPGRKMAKAVLAGQLNKEHNAYNTLFVDTAFNFFCLWRRI